MHAPIALDPRPSSYIASYHVTCIFEHFKTTFSFIYWKNKAGFCSVETETTFIIALPCEMIVDTFRLF